MDADALQRPAKVELLAQSSLHFPHVLFYALQVNLEIHTKGNQGRCLRTSLPDGKEASGSQTTWNWWRWTVPRSGQEDLQNAGKVQ